VQEWVGEQSFSFKGEKRVLWLVRFFLLLLIVVVVVHNLFFFGPPVFHHRLLTVVGCFMQVFVCAGLFCWLMGGREGAGREQGGWE
jgi:membrane protein YdbS with pleckstrin-like domain